MELRMKADIKQSIHLSGNKFYFISQVFCSIINNN